MIWGNKLRASILFLSRLFDLLYFCSCKCWRTPVLGLGLGVDVTFASDNNNNNNKNNNPRLNFLKGIVLGDKEQGVGIIDKR